MKIPSFHELTKLDDDELERIRIAAENFERKLWRWSFIIWLSTSIATAIRMLLWFITGC